VLAIAATAVIEGAGEAADGAAAAETGFFQERFQIAGSLAHALLQESILAGQGMAHAAELKQIAKADAHFGKLQGAGENFCRADCPGALVPGTVGGVGQGYDGDGLRGGQGGEFGDDVHAGHTRHGEGNENCFRTLPAKCFYAQARIVEDDGGRQLEPLEDALPQD
jgi:hypothetical protein